MSNFGVDLEDAGGSEGSTGLSGRGLSTSRGLVSDRRRPVGVTDCRPGSLGESKRSVGSTVGVASVKGVFIVAVTGGSFSDGEIAALSFAGDITRRRASASCLYVSGTGGTGGLEDSGEANREAVGSDGLVVGYMLASFQSDSSLYVLARWKHQTYAQTCLWPCFVNSIIELYSSCGLTLDPSWLLLELSLDLVPGRSDIVAIFSGLLLGKLFKSENLSQPSSLPLTLALAALFVLDSVRWFDGLMVPRDPPFATLTILEPRPIDCEVGNGGAGDCRVWKVCPFAPVALGPAW